MEEIDLSKIVLVVDDEEDVEFLFRQKFRKEIRSDLIVFHFSRSAESALKYLQELPDPSLVLILSDINMPGMNGLELLKIIKSKFHQIKVFMITAYEDEDNHQTAISYGADDYIHKPINFNQLKEKVLRCIET
jgi:CheY-like chemotaxis protein